MKADKKPFHNSSIPSDWEVKSLGEFAIKTKKMSGKTEHILNGYKQSPVGLIPSDWEVKQVREVCNKFLNGGTPSTQVGEYWSGKTPWITGADIVQKGISEIRRFISEKAVKESATNVIPKGSLLLVTRTGVGKVTIAPFDVAISQDLTGLILNEELIDTQFTFYFFDASENRLRELNQGTSIAGITREVLQSIYIPVPPLPEQRAIAHILSLMDTVINKNNQLIAKKEQQKKWLMQQLLTGRKRLKGFEKSEWCKLKLGDAFEFLKSYSISRDGLGTDNSAEAIYCVHYGDIHALYENEFLNFETQQGIPQILDNSYKIDKKDYLKDGDIVMADASEDYEGVGEVVEVLNINSKIAVGGLHTIVLRGNHNLVAIGFRGYLFSSESVRNTMRKMATGTSVYSVTKTTLTNLVFDIPESIKEQSAIAQVLQAADKEIQLLKDKTIKLKEKKKGLMQQLLTGKKRLKA